MLQRARDLSLLALLLSCSSTGAAPQTPAPPSAGAAPSPPTVELVESWPIETPLDHPDIPDAAEVWRSMIDGATRTLDIAQFYISTAPRTPLEPILAAIEAAAGRGVRVRVLVDESFYGRYPEAAERLAARPGVSLRRFDARASMGGVLHAKYFLVDGREAYLGSQNLDWRALTHIYEMGVRVRHPDVAAALGDVFAIDWALAGGEATLPRLAEPAAPPPAPIEVQQGGEALRLVPVASPQGFLPAATPWDLPRLRALIDGAARRVDVQLLSYRATTRDGAPFPELDLALRRAAARGVRVRLLVADWSKRATTIESLQRLAEVAGIEVKLVTIPRWSGGFLPFARVIHAKYLTVDGRAAWIGTSNWEGDYFTKSRNVGLIVEGASISRRLGEVFEELWAGPYAELVDPRATYTPPSIERDAPATPSSP